MVILDKQGNVIRDAMLWNDTSSAPQAAALIDKLGAAPAEGDEPDDVTARGKQRWVKAVGSSPRRLLHADQGGVGGRERA